MKKYTVYFNVYGKKLRTTVLARTPEDAGKQVRETIEIVKIVQAEPKEEPNDIFKDFDDVMKEFFDGDMFNKFFGSKKK